MKFTIFYSWQSDLHNNTNRGFIQDVISKSIASLSREGSFDLEISLDRDTKGVPGAPNISQTIIEKIKSCDVFVADVSIVTGGKPSGQRPSPNPNILIELGYAICCLGWEKILLFSNDLYGKDEDLPFDIRQHRRFKYVLKVEDEKAELKKGLVKDFSFAVREIIKHSSQTEKFKGPNLEPNWIVYDFQNGTKEQKAVLSFDRIIEPPNFEEKLAKDLEEVSKINGSCDPEWEAKVQTFKKEAERVALLQKTPEGQVSYFILSNLTKAVSISLSINNSGTLPANDIRAKIVLPDWLIGFEHFPDPEKFPRYPKIPAPIPREKKPTTVWTEDPLRRVFLDKNFVDPTLGLNKTFDCYLKGNKILFWADKLFHKHDLIPDNSNIFILRRTNLEKNDLFVDCEVFCVEYEDWKKIPLRIELK